ncbi:MAG TPA: hypothetical protein PKI01_05420 [Bacteroidales bacterium]|nr:hypothetical protein [Bacteroidales bacterium]
MKKPFFVLLAICLGLGLFQSCHKDNPDDLSDMRHVQISNLYETFSNDIFKTFLYSVIAINDSLYHPNDSANFRINDSCITLSVSANDTSTWPKTLHIAFTSGGCMCNDGIVRDGEIDIEIPSAGFPNKSEFTINFLCTYSFPETVTINGYKKICTASSSGLFFTDTTYWETWPVMNSFHWSANHTIQWVMGNSTHQNISDDLFIYNGTSTCLPVPLAENEELSFSTNIIEALQFRNYCFWIGSGKVEVIPKGLSIRTVTYLDSCINQAIVTANNEYREISF